MDTQDYLKKVGKDVYNKPNKLSMTFGGILLQFILEAWIM
jgi:hypothetical protein